MKQWLERVAKYFTKPQPIDHLGGRGENVAARFLRDLGYKVLIRNYKTEVGEIDIVARDGNTIVFVEVKTRVGEDVPPEEQVNDPKRHQITKAAKHYMARYGTPQPPARFDVIAILWPPNRDPVIRHTQSAFEATF
jgi:putative endonuclease